MMLTGATYGEMLVLGAGPFPWSAFSQKIPRCQRWKEMNPIHFTLPFIPQIDGCQLCAGLGKCRSVGPHITHRGSQEAGWQPQCRQVQTAARGWASRELQERGRGIKLSFRGRWSPHCAEHKRVSRTHPLSPNTEDPGQTIFKGQVGSENLWH